MGSIGGEPVCAITYGSSKWKYDNLKSLDELLKTELISIFVVQPWSMTNMF